MQELKSALSVTITISKISYLQQSVRITSLILDHHRRDSVTQVQSDINFVNSVLTFAVSSSTRSSHLEQISRTEAPATHMATPSLSTSVEGEKIEINRVLNELTFVAQ